MDTARVPSIVCIVGTRRPGSFTASCLALTAAELARSGAQVEIFDGSKVELGFPHEPATKDAKRLKLAVQRCSAVVLATPEYHGTFSASAKLFIENLGFPSLLKNKPISLLGVAGGRIGAIKAIEHLRGSCGHLGAVVVPGAISIANVRSSFDEEGLCIDEDTLSALNRIAKSTLDFVSLYQFKGE